MEEKDAHKKVALNFLEHIVTNKIDEAYERYVDMRGVHHNIFSPAGFPALKESMKENESNFPNKRIVMKNIVADGDMVAVHSQLFLTPGNRGMIVIHLFRFQNNKIVEMWDCAQKIPEKMINEDGAF